MSMLIAALAVLLVLGAWSVSPAIAADHDAIPHDFRLRAEYYPALPHLDTARAPRWYPWTLTLTADGRAHQESNRTVPGKRAIVRRSVRVAPGDLQRLVAEIRRSSFYFLAPDYAFEVTHHPTLVLRITMERRSHEVTVYAPDRVRDQPEVAAFLRVWNQTLRVVPPLNPGQRPD
jgi:hypothetical protein